MALHLNNARRVEIKWKTFAVDKNKEIYQR